MLRRPANIGFRTLTTVLAAAVVLLLTSCGKKTRVQVPRMPKVGETQTGIASWYGVPYHGRRAANGEIYDMNKLTAAHRQYPFETMVRVRNLGNRKEVDVRITDRGPFVDGRIIDLSRAAADRIDMVNAGITKVKLRVIRTPAKAKRK
jgi:rare lipoprotein A